MTFLKTAADNLLAVLYTFELIGTCFDLQLHADKSARMTQAQQSSASGDLRSCRSHQAG
jgi:hypothetical protein